MKKDEPFCLPSLVLFLWEVKLFPEQVKLFYILLSSLRSEMKNCGILTDADIHVIIYAIVCGYFSLIENAI